MRCLFAAALAISLAGQVGPALAYACNNNYTSIHLGTWCTRHPAARSTRSARRNVATAASAIQSITAGRALITVVWRTGIEPPLSVVLVLRCTIEA